jgi:hypothetical protein
VSALNIHSQLKTSNIFLEIIGRFSRHATVLAYPRSRQDLGLYRSRIRRFGL